MKSLLVLSVVALLVGCASSQNPPPQTPASPQSSFESLLGKPVAGKDIFKRYPASNDSIRGLNMDGCYQLVVSGALYPAFCLFGTTEEGINGSGVRMVIFHTNSSKVIACANSSRSGVEDNQFYYEADGQRQLVLSNINVKDKTPIQGDAQLGNTKLNFVYLSSHHSQSLIDSYQKHDDCRNVGFGELRQF